MKVATWIGSALFARVRLLACVCGGEHGEHVVAGLDPACGFIEVDAVVSKVLSHHTHVPGADPEFHLSELPERAPDVLIIHGPTVPGPSGLFRSNGILILGRQSDRLGLHDLRHTFERVALRGRQRLHAGVHKH